MLITKQYVEKINVGRNNWKFMIYYFLLIIVAAFGIFLRFYHLGTQSYWMDEGYTINAVLSIIEKGKSVLDSGQSYFCPIYCYPTAWIANILGQNASSFRLLSALAGAIFIPFIYIMTRKIFSKNTALLSTFFIIFSYWQIAWSRETRWYTLFELFFWITLFFFWKTYYAKKNRILNSILTILFTILAILTHEIGYFLPLIMLAWVFIDIVFITHEKIQKKKSIHFFMYSILSAIILILILKFVFKSSFIISLFASIHFYYSLPYYLGFILREYWLFIVFVLAAFFLHKKANSAKFYFLLWIFLSYFFAFSFFSNIVEYRYLFHVTPALIILGSFGMIKIAGHLKIKYTKVLFYIIMIGLFFIIKEGVLFPKAFYALESDPVISGKSYYATTPQPNFNKAYQYIKDNKKPDEIIITSHPQFNKIFLQESGYWIKYKYIGIDNTPNLIKNNKEHYVGAEVINNVGELDKTVRNNHGYIVFDQMAATRYSPDILSYIRNNLTQVFFDEINNYSKIWVYKF